MWRPFHDRCTIILQCGKVCASFLPHLSHFWATSPPHHLCTILKIWKFTASTPSIGTSFVLPLKDMIVVQWFCSAAKYVLPFCLIWATFEQPGPQPPLCNNFENVENLQHPRHQLEHPLYSLWKTEATIQTALTVTIPWSVNGRTWEAQMSLVLC